MTRSRSIFSLILAITVAHQIIPLQAGNAVPVLLWRDCGNSNPETGAVNPFLKTTQSEFNNVLTYVVGPSMAPIVVFLKDNICVEDFTQHKKLLQDVTTGCTFNYLPAVEAPLSVFKNLLSYNLSYYDNVDSIANGELVVVPITSLENMNDIYETLKESSPNLIAVITGNSCGYTLSERVKRETFANDNTTVFNITSDRVILYSKQAPLFKPSVDEDYIQLPSVPIVVKTRGSGTPEEPLILRLQFGKAGEKEEKYVFEFILEIKFFGYYTLKTVNYRANDTTQLPLVSNDDVVFPFNFSYHCSHETLFHNDSVILKIVDLQVQVDAQGWSFDESYDCVGYTTIPILTGMFVTAILAIIMIWALTMIMDIRTMDRFDDPKGKTITITGVE